MIPFDHITAWRAHAPWVDNSQVEQDLVISRALVEIFSHPMLADALALRGGTALSKLHLRPAARYSEDIDLVQQYGESVLWDAKSMILADQLERGWGRVEFVPLSRQYLHLSPLVGVA